MISRKRSAEELEQIISARIPPTTMARLERLKPYLFPDPNIIPSRSAIIRAALDMGLPLMERHFLGESGVLQREKEPVEANEGQEWDCEAAKQKLESRLFVKSLDDFTSHNSNGLESIASVKTSPQPVSDATEPEKSEALALSREWPEESGETTQRT